MFDIVERVERAICNDFRGPLCCQNNKTQKCYSGIYFKAATATIAAHLQALADAGMVTVPREPTEDMVKAAELDGHDQGVALDEMSPPLFFARSYTAMIDAYAPTPTAEEDNG